MLGFVRRSLAAPRTPDQLPGQATVVVARIKESWTQRIAMGLLCSTVVTIVMNFGGIKWLAVHVFALFLSLFGNDSYTVKPTEAIKGAAHDVVGKLKGEARNALPPVVAAGLVPMPGFGHKTPEQLKIEAEHKEAERLRREKSEIQSLYARAAVVRFDCDKDWPLEKLKVEVPLAEQRVAEAAKKKPYFERADKIGLTVEPSSDYKSLRSQVEAAERELANDAEYQAEHRAWERAMEEWRDNAAHGPNARCINPRCRHAMRINPAWAKKTLQCKACLTFFGGSRALALWSPPPAPKEPAPPRKNSGLLWRVFR